MKEIKCKGAGNLKHKNFFLIIGVVALLLGTSLVSAISNTSIDTKQVGNLDIVENELYLQTTNKPEIKYSFFFTNPEDHNSTIIKEIELSDKACINNPLIFAYPNDNTPLTSFAVEQYAKEWDAQRNAWRYRGRFDWYQTKHGAPFGDPGWDNWPYIVLDVKTIIEEQGTVHGSINDFAHAGWNVNEKTTASYPYEEIALLICSTIIGFIPYVGTAFSTGLGLASALRDVDPLPNYWWRGLQVYEGNGYFHLDFYVYPGESATVTVILDVWGTSWDRDYQHYALAWIIQITAPSENSPPNKPNPPSGPNEGKAGTSYMYYGTITDPNPGDFVYAEFDWGDGTTSGWIGPAPNGNEIARSHTWSQGTYSIRVRGKDEWGSIGPWSNPKTINMPMSLNLSQINLFSFNNMNFLDRGFN